MDVCRSKTWIRSDTTPSTSFGPAIASVIRHNITRCLDSCTVIPQTRTPILSVSSQRYSPHGQDTVDPRATFRAGTRGANGDDDRWGRGDVGEDEQRQRGCPATSASRSPEGPVQDEQSRNTVRTGAGGAVPSELCGCLPRTLCTYCQIRRAVLVATELEMSAHMPAHALALGLGDAILITYSGGALLTSPPFSWTTSRTTRPTNTEHPLCPLY